MRYSLKLAAIAVAMLTTLAAGNFAMAQTSEDLWKSLEKLPAAEREKKLLEGAKKEGEMVWYTNSGIENATRYIQGFKKKYPSINANFWRSKTRQVTQRIVAEANAGKHLVDVIKPSTDLLPILLERNLIGKYDTPLRAIYPAHAKSPFYTNMNYAFRVFAFNPRKVNAKDAPKS
jgi:iron(III) transport system substrate-binding protein